MGTVYNRGTRDRPNWWGKYKDLDGRWKAVPTSQPTKIQARKWIEEREANVANNKPAIEAPKAELIFDEAADYWLKNHSAAACTSHDDNVGRMKHLRKAFGKLPLSQITAVRIDEFKADRKRETKIDRATKKKGPRWAVATINRMLALLRKVLNDSVRWGHLSHAPKVRLLPAPETDFDFLQKDEAERLLVWTKENARDVFPLYLMAIRLGPRMGELYGLRWTDVNFSSGLVTFCRSYERPYTKSKRVRHVRLGEQLTAVLEDWKRACPRGDLVFPMPEGEMRTPERPPVGWDDHLARAGVHAITFHDLRHTAASLMVMSGMNLRAVQKILGHSTITTTERYAHLAPDFLEREADRVSLDLGGRGKLVALPGGKDA